MDAKQTRSALIPTITTFCGVPIIAADQTGDKPDGPHATFKITSPYIKGVGQPEQTAIQGDTFKIQYAESYKIIYSFTAYDFDDDASMDLAQKIHDWFAFFGSDHLDNNNIVVAEQSGVGNRDAFVVDGYERRNGFDVTLRVTRELINDSEYFTTVEGLTD